jgi:hypothetical protein
VVDFQHPVDFRTPPSVSLALESPLSVSFPATSSAAGPGSARHASCNKGLSGEEPKCRREASRNCWEES